MMTSLPVQQLWVESPRGNTGEPSGRRSVPNIPSVLSVPNMETQTNVEER